MNASIEIKHQFSKTKICKHFLENKCTNKKNCNYAHVLEELKPLPNLKNTKLCSSLKKNIPCNNHLCAYAHGIENLQPSTNLSTYKTNLCYFWKKKKCMNQWKCRFAHGIEEIRPLKTESQISLHTKHDWKNQVDKKIESKAPKKPEKKEENIITKDTEKIIENILNEIQKRKEINYANENINWDFNVKKQNSKHKHEMCDNKREIKNSKDESSMMYNFKLLENLSTIDSEFPYFDECFTYGNDKDDINDSNVVNSYFDIFPTMHMNDYPVFGDKQICGSTNCSSKDDNYNYIQMLEGDENLSYDMNSFNLGFLTQKNDYHTIFDKNICTDMNNNIRNNLKRHQNDQEIISNRNKKHSETNSEYLNDIYKSINEEFSKKRENVYIY
ncbi:zinc finger C-x8-C-x5-C-x3-H type, putative [Plasmodium berghei]|uniref:Zinc finger (CCCH type) protein, putative n=2 Tax=Plasmodium berghei TaxID=5821 RepID=A0A509AN36_PLABA|nr:zinc finger (CCCH type) protein, putative [Plasmodium berghei ANKA]CXI73787.1 zinc finger C-x8-C-x5-C-x3-H type, putative [Plasmodium berghei]SCM24598.1 zinc finger C-x8-C-x5-C-x3-H type, putative [Plasmodium berghei]SCN27112.1 zinc finger C-x8-C-x5-C-x3-H type, putative [Plasmodium berghei]SCO61621.1 zinc finger C-x8-C-x5-C-x3-H type, putative [Plasmodium berghei]SCO63535.1 zinc finger C-x8-C-x5-C-x3-H type, putative [Plasmodium berghei]|eukprot:XP_034422746.1 zinc finger (CCCH type) protein, putative [Plasmodium berghei ANKA]